MANLQLPPPPRKSGPKRVGFSLGLASLPKPRRNKAIRRMLASVLPESPREGLSRLTAQPVPTKQWKVRVATSIFLNKDKEPLKANVRRELSTFSFEDWITESKAFMTEFVAETNFDLRCRPPIATFLSNHKSFSSPPVTYDSIIT